MAAAKGKGLSVLVKGSEIPPSIGKKRGMKGNKPNHIGIVLSSDIAGIKV